VPTYVKDSSNLISLPSGLETPFEAQSDYITPNDQFFVCSASDTPRIDAETWTMTVAGDGVGRAITLSYRDLMAMPHKTVAAYLECAGNHRRLFEDVLGEPLNRRPSMTEVKWGLGGVGMAEWSGVRLRDVLRQAKIRDSAYHVCPVGLDVGLEDADGIRVPMPVTKAMHPDTLIALTMNGDPLPPDHGFPARLIVPGWVGTYSIKWLGRIDVTTAHQWVYRNTELYVLAGDDWPVDASAPSKGAPITEQTIKSSLALPWPAELSPGPHRLHGWARSPDAEIVSVEWSVASDETWHEAEICSPNYRWAWVRFELEWEATTGTHELLTRASDKAGRTQPDRVPFNDGGYLFNMVHPHPVHVR